MRKLLIPLLAALALPTAVNAGDLGNADYPSIEKIFPILKGKSKSEVRRKEVLVESLQDEFKMECGIDVRAYQGSRVDKCTIRFKNGRLTVDDSYGIKPEQVRTIISDRYYGFMEVHYIDQNGNYSMAYIFHPKAREQGAFLLLHPFNTRLFKWMHTGR
tara:strand:- start:347 stop:823 length:477 start_codon:yes stop_codon:yes gene_type:complete